MDFESPDVAKEFPGLFEGSKRNSRNDSDDEKSSRKDLLGKKKDKKESKKDKGYVAFAGESSGDDADDAKSPSKTKKLKSSSFKFPGKKEKPKIKEKEKKEEKEKASRKDSKEYKKDNIETEKVKKKRESKLLKIRDKKKKNTHEDKEEQPVFGIPLHILVERRKCHDGIEIPIIVRECIDYIEEHGLACEGIYRTSGLKSKVRNLKNQYNAGEKVYLYEHEPHIVASLLKQFLRDLPEPILTHELAPKFEEAAAMKNEEKKIETLQHLLNELPKCNKLLLSWIFVHMQHVIALEKRNKMNLQNVSIVLSPTLQISHNILQAFFTYASILFNGVEIKKYIPPIDEDSTRLSLELPDSPSAIAEELSKRENLLNNLHSQLNAGVRDEQKEEQLWEVQRIVTQLKRKLRFLRQVQISSNLKYEDKTDSRSVKSSSSLKMDIQTPKLSIGVPNSSVDVSEEQVIKDVNQNVEVEESKSEETPVDSSNIHEAHSLNSDKEAVDEATLDSQGNECTAPEEQPTPETVLVEKDTAVEDESQPVVNSEEPKSETEPVTATEAVEDENIYALIYEEHMLRLQGDELELLGDELRRKINSERMEIERLKMEINEYKHLYKYRFYSFDSSENTSSESEDSCQSDYNEDDALTKVLQDLMARNKELEDNNAEISKKIQNERELCLNIKVQMRMLQTEVKYM